MVKARWHPPRLRPDDPDILTRAHKNSKRRGAPKRRALNRQDACYLSELPDLHRGPLAASFRPEVLDRESGPIFLDRDPARLGLISDPLCQSPANADQICIKLPVPSLGDGDPAWHRKAAKPEGTHVRRCDVRRHSSEQWRPDHLHQVTHSRSHRRCLVIHQNRGRLILQEEFIVPQFAITVPWTATNASPTFGASAMKRSTVQTDTSCPPARTSTQSISATTPNRDAIAPRI